MRQFALICKINPGEISSFESVSASELSERLEYDAKRANMYHRRAWNMAVIHQSAAMFTTVTPNETGNAAVTYFSKDISENISENEIPSNAARIERAGKDPAMCDLFYQIF